MVKRRCEGSFGSGGEREEADLRNLEAREIRPGSSVYLRPRLCSHRRPLLLGHLNSSPQTPDTGNRHKTTTRMSRRNAASASAPAASTSRTALSSKPAPLRRVAASNRLPFRKSLIQVGESYEEFDWEERDELIRRPAQSALAGLLQVGEEDDIVGLDSGRIKRYEAFKSAYIHFAHRTIHPNGTDEVLQVSN